MDDVYAEFETASAAKKMKKSEEESVERTTPSSSSSHGGAEEPLEGVESVAGGASSDADDASMTMIDLKEESNSSVDSFISAADAAELNEKMAAKAEEKLKKTKPNTLLVAVPATTNIHLEGPKTVEVAVKGATKSSSARITPPPTEAVGTRPPPDAAPDTPDSSNEATPARKSTNATSDSNGGAAKDVTVTTTNATMTNATTISKTKNLTKTVSGGDVAATRPTRTSISKTVMT